MKPLLVIRLVSVALLVSQACTASAAPETTQVPGAPRPPKSASGIEIDATVRKDVLTALARELEAKYAIEGTAKELAARVRARQKANAYGNIATAPEFASALTDDLYAVAHDKHLRVNYSFAPLPQGPPGPPPPEVLSRLRKMNGAIPKVEILDANVGYMRVNGVPPVDIARGAVAAAFAFLHNTDALIIDNRGNGGGDPNTVALYVSYLSEGKPFVVNTFHWRAGNRVEEFRSTDLGELTYGSHKPVFVLTSPATFSGGEELAYDLQVLKRAVLVGEVTGGGANPGGPVFLPHQFVVNMPSGRGVNPITGTSWEGVGVKPDVPVDAARALSKTHALAVERLMAETTDPAAHSMLMAVAMKLELVAAADSEARLPSAEIVGTYALEAGPGPAVTILERDGRLVQHIDGAPDVELVLLKGNRYQQQGRAAESVTSFRRQDGRTEMLLEAPFGPPTIREKQ
jgi:hypothetical protein